ncbi:MAG TPA: heavy metal-associated domain-containing protein, partial [Ignavibacteria bacterium]
EPGKCPICKMDMVSKKDFNKEMMEKHEGLEKKQEGKDNLLHFEIQLSTIKTWECESTIKKALKKTPGVVDFFVDILDSRVHALIDKNITTKKDVEKVISDLGYDANDTKANPEAAANKPAECK